MGRSVTFPTPGYGCGVSATRVSTSSSFCWIDHPSERGPRAHEFYIEIHRPFDRHEIETPFSQRDL